MPTADDFFTDLAFHVFSLLKPLVAGIVIDHLILPMQEVCGRGEVMHIGGRRLDGMDQAALAVHPDVHLHAEVPLVAFLGLVHLEISSPFLGHLETFQSHRSRLDEIPCCNNGG